MIVVSNTSPLIALAKIEHLFILPELFERILIPSIVADEFYANCTATEKRDFETCRKSVIQTIDTVFTGHFSRQLDAGEQAVLGLALQNKIDTVLLDDRKAYNEAKEHGLMPVSTRAILQTAERFGTVKDFYELENKLREKLFFMPGY